jgi:hypothetical protein
MEIAMTTQNDQPLGLIDVSAIEYEARAARAEVMRAAVVALPALFAQVVGRLRSKREPQTSGADLTFATRLPRYSSANVKSKAPLATITC